MGGVGLSCLKKDPEFTIVTDLAQLKGTTKSQ